MDLAAIELNRC